MREFPVDDTAGGGRPAGMDHHLLIVDDDEFVLSLLGAYLEVEGFRVSLVTSGREMLAVLGKELVHLILLDLALPDEDGLALTRQIRARSSVPIIVLTARTAQEDRLVALEPGADDYLTKPCDPREIALRIRNVLARSEGQEVAGTTAERRDMVNFDGWSLDLAGHSVTAPDGNDVPLTGAEFNLFAALARAPNRVLTRDHLLDAVSQNDEAPTDRTIDVVISRLRKKIERDPGNPSLIVTVRGCGYKFTASPS